MYSEKEQLLVYRIFSVLSLAAISWISWNLISSGETPTVCLFKNVTGIPCPSCGITHSVMSILHLQFSEALNANALGFAAMVLMIFVPPMLFADLFWGKKYFINSYQWAENKLKRHLLISIPLALLLIGNWILLIYKS